MKRLMFIASALLAFTLAGDRGTSVRLAMRGRDSAQRADVSAVSEIESSPHILSPGGSPLMKLSVVAADEAVNVVVNRFQTSFGLPLPPL